LERCLPGGWSSGFQPLQAFERQDAGAPVYPVAVLPTLALFAVAQFNGAPAPTFRVAHEQEIAAFARKYEALGPRLPVVINLDEDYVTAAKTRNSIEVVDDCGEALCGVATDDFPEDWQVAELRALFTPASALRGERDAFAIALLGTFHGEEVDRWAADCVRANAAAENDPLVAVPLLASRIRFADPKHTLRFEEAMARARTVDEAKWRKELERHVSPRTRGQDMPALHGATFSLTNRIEKSTIASGANEELKRLRALGYDAIALIPFAGQRGPEATELRRFAGSPASETDLALRLAALRAHRLGMRVLVKPHVWSRPGDPTKIDPGPEQWPAWFASYTHYLVHEALLARALRADCLAIGTELSRSEARPEWHALIAQVRALYHGPITYAANFDAAERTPFWAELDAIGIDAYFPLSPKPDASDDDLRSGAAAVVARVEALAAKSGKPVVLTELGYPASAAPWVEPWHEERGSTPHPEEQARAFRAMLGALGKSRALRGFFVWKYESDPAARDGAGYLPKEKAAEDVIRSYLPRNQ